MIEDYFQQIDALIANTNIVQSSCLTYDQRSTYVGFIRASLYFIDGTILHIREFVNVQYDIDRYMYVYQYQYVDGTLIFRYDNPPHFPQLSSFPHHKHSDSETHVVPSTGPDLQAILIEIHNLIIT